LNKELIINAAPQGVEIALLEDKRLVEMHNEKADASFAVGDLYLGKVKKLIPGLNAAFVDVGFEKDAFLHYTDLSPYAKSLLKYKSTDCWVPARYLVTNKGQDHRTIGRNCEQKATP